MWSDEKTFSIHPHIYFVHSEAGAETADQSFALNV